MIETGFYITGGSLQQNAPSYVARQADLDLYEALWRGEFCYVLTARQMGKSSLMVHTAARLREAGVQVILLDLQAVGQNLSVEQWYDGLLALVGQQLDLEAELEAFWLDHPRLGPLQRWMAALREVILARVPGRVVVFIDEIDAVSALPFSANVPRATDLMLALCPKPGEEDLRGFEWRYFWRLAQQDDARWVLSTEQWILNSLAFSPDGRTLATAGLGGNVKLWDVRTRRGGRIFQAEGPWPSVAYSPDGQLMAMGVDGNAAKLWDVASGRQVASLSGHKVQTGMVTFSRRGRLLATMGADDTVFLWKISSPGPRVRRVASFVAQPNGIGWAAFSPRDPLLATSGVDGTVHLWDVTPFENGQAGILSAVREIGQLKGPSGTASGITFSPDGRLLATTGYGTRAATLWDVTTRRIVAALNGEWGKRVCLAFSPDCTRLAIGSDDSIVRLWSVRELREIATLKGHRKDITCLACPLRGCTPSPDGKTLASGSVDETVRLWDLAPRQPEFLRGHTNQDRSTSPPTGSGWPWVAATSPSSSGKSDRGVGSPRCGATRIRSVGSASHQTGYPREAWVNIGVDVSRWGPPVLEHDDLDPVGDDQGPKRCWGRALHTRWQVPHWCRARWRNPHLARGDARGGGAAARP